MKTFRTPKEYLYSWKFRTNKTIRLITIFLLSIITSKSLGQCVAPDLVFQNPILINGVDKSVGAVYLFENVTPGVDCHAEIIDIVGGAGLSDIDNTSNGYNDAFQPYVFAAANTTSYLDWKFTFKIAGTSSDTSFPCLAVTAIDVDGNNMDLREFVEAATPGSYGIDPFSVLAVSFDGIRNRAEGQITTIPLIDTNHREAMFQMNFTNINSLLYRNGAITTGDTMTRHTCIYFKPFFSQYTLLPVKLHYFTAQVTDNATVLRWSASDEQQLNFYTVQRSNDGKSWYDIRLQAPATFSGINNYSYSDKEKFDNKVWYRLKQTDQKGLTTYSKVLQIGQNSFGKSINIGQAAFAGETLQVMVTSPITQSIRLDVYSVNGQQLTTEQKPLYPGTNNLQIQLASGLSNGVYVLKAQNIQGQPITTLKVIKH